MPNDSAGFFRNLAGYANEYLRSKRRALQDADPQTAVDSAGAGTGYSFDGQEVGFEELRDIKDLRDSGGQIAQLMDHKARLNFGEGAEFAVEDNEETEQPVDGEPMTLKDWLELQFPYIDGQVLELGKDALWYPAAVGEIRETQAGGFSEFLPAEPWTVLPKTNGKGEIIAWQQQVRQNGHQKEQTLNADALTNIVLNKESARDKTGISEVLRNDDEIRAFKENEQAINNAIELHGFPQRHIKVGREEGAPVRDDDLRRVRSLFDPRSTDANTAYFTGQDVDVETLEAENFDFEAIHEMDMRNLTTALGLPLEAGNVGSDGLGSGKPAELRFALLKLAIQANQRSFSTQFVEKVVRPVVRDYSPFDHTANITLRIDSPLEDIGETADLIQKVGDHMTNAEKRRRLDLPEPEDDEVADSYRSPADIEAAEKGDAQEGDPLAGLFEDRAEQAVDQQLDGRELREQISVPERDTTGRTLAAVDRPANGDPRVAFHTPTSESVDGQIEPITDAAADAAGVDSLPFETRATPSGLLFTFAGDDATNMPHPMLDVSESAAHETAGNAGKSTLFAAGSVDDQTLQPCFRLSERLSDEQVAEIERLYGFVAGIDATGYHNETRFYLDTGRVELSHIALDVAEILVRRTVAETDISVADHTVKVLPAGNGERELQDISDIDTGDYPDAAQENARMALDAREDTDNPNDCGTQVGWERANQLANGEDLSEDTIERMASFARHEDNKAQGEDGRADCGWMMWKAWGGDEGIAWAERKSDQFDRARENAALSGETDFRCLGEGVTDDDLAHAPEWDRPLLEMFRGVSDPDADMGRTLVSFAASDTPEFVLERIREAIMGGATFAQFDGIDDGRIMDFRQEFADALGTDDFTLDSLTDNLMDFADLSRDDAERIARTESSAALNKARELGYEQRGEGDELFYWTGADPGDARQTEACEWLIRQTNPFHGGDPVPMNELRDMLTDAAEQDDDIPTSMVRADSWVIHINERSTFAKAPPGV